MRKQEAKHLDKILSYFTPKALRVQVDKEDNALCEKLESFGYIEIYNRSPDGYYILLTDRGNEFKAKGGFKECKKTTRNWNKIGVITTAIITVISILVTLFVSIF